MTVQERYTGYDLFAWFYNRHWGWFARYACVWIEAFLLPGVPEGGRVLDLCCGTGQLAGMLTGMGYRVTGIDGSEEVLRYARENAPAAEFLLADARGFSLPQEFHAAVSTFDSLNHIMTLEELTAAFRNVHACLLPGGGFLFDLNIRAGYLSNWQGSFGIVEDDHVCVARSQYDDAEGLARLDLTLFRLQEEWQRTDLTLQQRCYEESDVCAALEAVGFTGCQVFDAERRPEGIERLPGGRALFLARKA
ncbi:MAG: class I SAM-dependent methyltransferase [Armatimonadota bacterium]